MSGFQFKCRTVVNVSFIRSETEWNGLCALGSGVYHDAILDPFVDRTRHRVSPTTSLRFRTEMRKPPKLNTKRRCELIGCLTCVIPLDLRFNSTTNSRLIQSIVFNSFLLQNENTIRRQKPPKGQNSVYWHLLDQSCTQYTKGARRIQY
jgi:hypothetical protein